MRPSQSDPIYKVETPLAIKSSPKRNAGRKPKRARRTPESWTPASIARNCTRKRLPACESFIAQRPIRIGSIGPSRVVRMPVGKKAICPARTSFRFDDDDDDDAREGSG